MLAERKLQNVSSATFRDHFATKGEYDKVKQLFIATKAETIEN
jgi:hypothetical protein